MAIVQNALTNSVKRIPKLYNLGWGFLVAWGTSTTFSDIFAKNGIQSFDLFWITSMFVTSLVLLLLAFVDTPFLTDSSKRRMTIAASVLISLGTIVMVLAYSSGGMLSVLFQAIGGAIPAIGIAILTVLWGFYYSRLDAKEIENYAIFSSLLMIVCYVLVISTVWFVSVVLVIIFPLASGVCLLYANKREEQKRAVDADIEENAITQPVSRLLALRGFSRIGLGISASAIAISIFWSFIGMGVVVITGFLFKLSFLAGGAVAIVLTIYCVMFARRLNLNSLYRWVCPLVVIGFSFAVHSSPHTSFIASLFIFGAKMALDLLSFIFLAEFSSREKIPANTVFGIGRFFLEGGLLIGCLVAYPLFSYIAQDGVSLAVVLMAISALLVTMTMFSMIDQDTLQNSRLANNAVRESISSLLLQQCDRVSERYRLSKREREILVYLARGRSLPYIRNELGIAKSTIDTHVRHIYSKLDIHSKEELISIVENIVESD